jgi:hypothetical protein
MDIQRWLDETILPERPTSPANKGKRNPVPLVKRPEQSSKGKRRRKPTTSDSSLLDTPPQRKITPPVVSHARFDEIADDSASSGASEPSSGSLSSMSSHHYARKPRRKTRPERYEPAPKDVKERGTHIRRHRKGESSKTKRRHKRKKVDQLGTGIVQAFHAKNVSRDRLTVGSTTKCLAF